MPLVTGFPVTAVRKCGFLTQSSTRVATLHSGKVQRECQKAGACAHHAVPFPNAALEAAKKHGRQKPQEVLVEREAVQLLNDKLVFENRYFHSKQEGGKLLKKNSSSLQIPKIFETLGAWNGVCDTQVGLSPLLFSC